MVSAKPTKLPKWTTLIGVLLLVSVASLCQAQTKKLDSLRQQINQYQKRDTIRLDKIMNYVVASANENTSLLLPYMREMIGLSKALHFKKGLQSGYLVGQLYYSDRGELEQAMRYADSAFASLKDDTAKRAQIKIAYLHNNVGGDYLKMRDYAQALSHYTKCAKLLEHYQPENLSAAYDGIAMVYEGMLQPKKAIEYNEKAIAAAEMYGNKNAIAKRQLNYIVKLINMEKFDLAETRLTKVEHLVKEVNTSFTWFLFYQNKGHLLRHQKEYNAAIASFIKAKDYAQGSDDKYQYLSILDPLCKTLMQAGQLNAAKLYIDTLLKKGVTYQMKFARLSGYANAAEWYAKKGNYKMANEYLLHQRALSDSITSEETKEKIAMMEARFKVQGKDNEIKILQDEKKIQQLSLRQKSTLNYILAGGALALIAFAILSYRNYRNRQQLQQQRINELETEKQLTATAAVLKGEEQERSRLAKDLHDGLGGMLSGIKLSLNNMKGNLIMTSENADAFERSIGMLDNTIREMRRVAHNMMPEMLVKYGLDTALKELCVEISRSTGLKANYQSIEMDKIEIEQPIAIAIYRIVQELSGNAIKHAGAKILLVQIHALPDEKQLAITVEDDGKGFEPTQLEATAGMGWMNIRNRVDFLKGKLDINSAPGTGTSVLLEINY